MNNTEIAKALNVLIPEGNWGVFYGDANNSEEYNQAFYFTGLGTKPTWEQVKAVVLPTPQEPTIEEKLASVGLSVADLKQALGL